MNFWNSKSDKLKNMSFKIGFNFCENITDSQREIFFQAASRWSQIITSDPPEYILSDGTTVEGVLISVKVADIDGPRGKLAFATYNHNHIRPISGIPATGAIIMDETDLKRTEKEGYLICLLYTSPSPRDRQKSRMPSSA